MQKRRGMRQEWAAHPASYSLVQREGRDFQDVPVTSGGDAGLKSSIAVSTFLLVLPVNYGRPPLTTVDGGGRQ